MKELIIEYDTNYTTETTIRKWGNSQGIRIPKEVLGKINLVENDIVQICVYEGKMVIEKATKKKYKNLKERLETFYEKPIEEIFVDTIEEVDIGSPVGKEAW